jgi:hypothetical protein
MHAIGTLLYVKLSYHEGDKTMNDCYGISLLNLGILK